jgi:hypothetical protein
MPNERAITARQSILNGPGIDRTPYSSKIKWGETELALLGCYPDDEVVRITGRSLKEVQAKRLELNKAHR